LNRAKLQAQLWNCVLHLRNGQYYRNEFKDFIASVDLCRLNKQDTPDFVYGRFDGVVIKRLVSAFSFRPTVVSTLPYMVNPIATNPYAMNMRPQVTAVPMINMRIPPTATNYGNIDLSSATTQVQFFIENGQIIPKQTDLIWSRGVLIFYVDRRATSIKINDHLSQFNLTKLPVPIAGFEKLNNAKVDYKHLIRIRDEEYFLQSVVFSEVNIEDKNGIPTETDVVIGSSAIVFIRNTQEGKFTNENNDYVPIIYDPYSPVIMPPGSPARGPIHRLTNSSIASESIKVDDKNSNAPYLCSHRGTIFVYKSVNDNDAEKEIGL
jgi:hypothetical protein